MIVSMYALITLHNKTKRYYADSGYIDYSVSYPKGFKLVVRIQDLKNGSHSRVRVRCDYCGKVYVANYNNIMRNNSIIEKHCCENCTPSKTKEVDNILFINGHPMRDPKYADRFRGKNSPSYNPELTDEERILARNTPESRQWTKKVYKNSSWCCQVCGERGKLYAHHKYSWNKYPNLRYDEENGVAMCKDCHNLFHEIYGRGENTAEEYEEFIFEFGVSRNKLKEMIEYRKINRYIPGACAVVRLNDGKNYVSLNEAAKDNGVSKDAVSRAIKRGTSCKGVYYQYRAVIKDDDARCKMFLERQQATKKKLPHNARKVICIETNKVYDSTGEAAGFLGVGRSTAVKGINKVISGLQATYKGYHWMIA